MRYKKNLYYMKTTYGDACAWKETDLPGIVDLLGISRTQFLSYQQVYKFPFIVLSKADGGYYYISDDYGDFGNYYGELDDCPIIRGYDKKIN